MGGHAAFDEFPSHGFESEPDLALVSAISARPLDLDQAWKDSAGQKENHRALLDTDLENHLRRTANAKAVSTHGVLYPGMTSKP